MSRDLRRTLEARRNAAPAGQLAAAEPGASDWAPDDGPAPRFRARGPFDADDCPVFAATFPVPDRAARPGATGARESRSGAAPLDCRRICEARSRVCPLRTASVRSAKPRRLRGGLDFRRLRRVLGYIEGHIDERISCVRLANVACLSRQYFTSAFTTSMGLSPHSYMIRRRIRRAEMLLAGTDMSITAIALEVGFSNHGHFSAIFREFTGATPSGFRTAARLAGA